MVNRYTSDRKLRSDDAYSPDGAGGLRPDRAVVVYAQRCREVSGCDALMLGRGMVADPGLARAIRAADSGQPGADAVGWVDLVPHLAAFWQLVCNDLEPRQRAGRLKQWLNLLRRRFVEAEAAYQQVRTMTDQRAITLWVAALEEAAKAPAHQAG